MFAPIDRSAAPNMLDELERAVDNAVNVVRCTTRNPRFVAGAGATGLREGLVGCAKSGDPFSNMEG